MNKKKRVFVGLSGGVDSAVSAALLKRDGYDVTGVFIKIWQPEFIECTWEKDRIDAMRVAVALDVPFQEIDLSDDYRKHVVEHMVADYERGVTPNPDVLCNERIKFGSFYSWARTQGAEYVATGHYARIGAMPEPALLRGLDTEKDQSYFLYRMPREALAHTLFPVGAFKKSEVRAMARQFDLPVHSKKDSQGLCFVGDITMSEFLKRYIQVCEGDVLNHRGEVIGRHEGAALYTVGQRHGFSVRHASHATRPHFVTRIDTRTNSITVSSNKSDCERDAFDMYNMHVLAHGLDGEHGAQGRYRERPFFVTVRNAHVTMNAPRVVSPGQSLVLYDDERCLGGGFIAASA